MITKVEKTFTNTANEFNTDCNFAKISKISELEYMADLVPQLHKMSHGLGEKTLSYLFEMVMVEIRLQLDVEKYKANTLDMR